MAGTLRDRIAAPMGHPIHPALVTLPIGAWVLASVADVASQFAGEAEVFTKGAYWLVIAGIAGGAIAAVFGLLDLPNAEHDARRTALVHMALNVVVITIQVVSAGLRRGDLDAGSVGAAPMVLSLAAVVVLAVSGWLGGELTYRHGVRVQPAHDRDAGVDDPRA